MKSSPCLVRLDSRLHFRVVPLSRFVQQLRVFLLYVATVADGVNLVEVFLRVEAPLFHHFLELLVPKCEAEGQGVKFFLLPISKFCVFIHGLYPPNLYHVLSSIRLGL